MAEPELGASYRKATQPIYNIAATAVLHVFASARTGYGGIYDFEYWLFSWKSVIFYNQTCNLQMPLCLRQLVLERTRHGIIITQKMDKLNDSSELEQSLHLVTDDMVSI